MTAAAHFCNILRVSDFVQPGCDVIVKPVNKLIFFMAYPAYLQGIFWVSGLCLIWREHFLIKIPLLLYVKTAVRWTVP